MRIFIITILLFFSVSSIAQQNEEKFFFHDISFEYGLFASLNSSRYENLVGWKYSLQTSYYFFNDMGFRTGVSLVNDLEGTNKFYSVPIQFVYRTSIDKSFMIGGSVDSFEELLFKIFLGLIPRQADYHCGINVGYIEPDNNLGLSSINGGEWVQEGYQTEQRFLTTLDLGLRLQYKIKRVGIIVAPSVNYVLSKNFKYYSETGYNNGYTPQWFLSMTMGLSYQF